VPPAILAATHPAIRGRWRYLITRIPNVFSKNRQTAMWLIALPWGQLSDRNRTAASDQLKKELSSTTHDSARFFAPVCAFLCNSMCTRPLRFRTGRL